MTTWNAPRSRQAWGRPGTPPDHARPEDDPERPPTLKTRPSTPATLPRTPSPAQEKDPSRGRPAPPPTVLLRTNHKGHSQGQVPGSTSLSFPPHPPTRTGLMGGASPHPNQPPPPPLIPNSIHFLTSLPVCSQDHLQCQFSQCLPCVHL